MHAQVEPHHEVLIFDALAVEEFAKVLLGTSGIVDILHTVSILFRVVVF